MRLSKRLEELVSFVREGGRVADIGTDHGYIPIALVEEKKAVSAIAMDVRKGPLERAKEHIVEHGLQEKIELRLSDGAKELREGEADTVVIAGMGGELIIRIMREGRHMWESVSQWVLSPQSEIPAVRRFLTEQGFQIERETLIKDEGKFYTIMSVLFQSDTQKPKVHAEAYTVEELYGACLLREKNSVLLEFLEKERESKQKILEGISAQTGTAALQRRRELELELEKNQEALAYWK